MNPKLVVGNIFTHVDELKGFALEQGFSGIEWSFDVNTLPETPSEETKWAKEVSALTPLEVRYHCPFYQVDLGHHNPREAQAAERIFRHIIRLVSKAGGRYLSIHIGLGRDSTEPLSWDETIDNLGRLVGFAHNQRVTLCLENLAWGWTSRPNLFEKLIRKSGAGVTFDIGHAYACEAVRSQLYSIEDFVTPHADRVFNAHVYHRELEGIGHEPPARLEDIKDRLAVLNAVGCEWWVIEINEKEGLLQTKRIIEEYLSRANFQVEKKEIAE
jgi:sugar phosphate isomerase/epimerase